MPRSFFDRQREKWAFVQRDDLVNTKLAIFVHGWRGGYLSTWGDLAYYLVTHADLNPVLGRWDYFFVGYETYSLNSLLDIARIVATKWKTAARGRPPFQHSHKSLALVGHSLGTLGIRQLLCAVSEQPVGMLDALHCVLFFGSPLNGSPLAVAGGAARFADAIRGRLGALLPNAYQINDALRSDKQILKMLHAWNESIRMYGDYPKLEIKIIMGADDLVVYQGGIAQWTGNSDRNEHPLNHSQLCTVLYEGAKTEAFIIDELVGELK